MDHRAGLANARRVYLHYRFAKTPDYSKLSDDIGGVVENYERACDELDRLRAYMREARRRIGFMTNSEIAELLEEGYSEGLV